MKKILLIFISLSLLLSSLPAFASSDDVTNADYPLRLEGLGITGTYDDNLSYDKPVSRAEYAVLLTKLLGITDTFEPNTAIYKDVSQDHNMAAEISIVKDLGFFTGYADDKFYPQELVTLEEVKESLKKILGYNNLPQKEADRRMSLEIVKSITSEKYPSRGDVLKIFDNCLEAEIVDIQVSDESTDIYDTKKTFLSKYRDMYIARGIVTGNGVTTLTQEKAMKEGYILIDDIMFSIDVNFNKDYLGMQVEYYYTDNQGDYFIEYMYPFKNNVLNLTDEYIVDYESGNTQLRSYMYYDYNYRLKKATLSEELSVIINGIADPEYSIKDTRPDLGDVKLIDNDNDEVYDVLIAFNSDTEMCVSEVAYKKDGYSILDMIDKSRVCEIKIDGDREYYSVYKNGTKLTAAAIKTGDSILVGTNSKTGYKVIKVSEDIVTGVIENVSEEGVVIEGVEYKITANCLASANSGKIQTLQAGKEVTAYLNVYGRIQYFEYAKAKDFQYGIYIKSFEDTDEEDKYFVKIFNTEGIVKTYTMKDKVTLSYEGYAGGRRLDVADAVAIIESDNPVDAVRKNDVVKDTFRQLIEFRASEKGVISAINLVASTADAENYDNRYPLNYGGMVAIKSGKYTYYPYSLTAYGTMSIGSKFIANTDTQFFDIYTDEENFVTTKGVVPPSNDGSIDLYVYDVDEKLAAGVVIRCYSTSEDTQSFDDSVSQPLIVTALGKGVNDDGEVMDYIKGIENGAEKTIYYDRNDYKEFITDTLDAIKPGDMIVYNLSNAGKFLGIARKFEADKTGVYGGNNLVKEIASVHGQANLNSQTQQKMYYGKVVRNMDGYIVLYLGETGGNIVVDCSSYTGYVNTIEKRGNKVYYDSSKTLSDVKPGDEIVISVKYTGKKTSIYLIDYEE